MNIKKEVLNKSVSFNDFLNEELKDQEFQKEYLKFNIEDYAQNGDYSFFFKSLEKVVKLRTSVSQLAKDLDINRSNLSNILKGKVQPSFGTTIKILRGLGAEIEVKFG